MCEQISEKELENLVSEYKGDVENISPDTPFKFEYAFELITEKGTLYKNISNKVD